MLCTETLLLLQNILVNTGGARPTPCTTSGISLERCVHNKPDSVQHRVINPLCCHTTTEHVGQTWLLLKSNGRMEINNNHLYSYSWKEGRTKEGEKERKERRKEARKEVKEKRRKEEEEKEEEEEEEEEEEDEKEEEEEEEEEQTLHDKTDTFHPSMLLESRWWRMP